jgi:hypothetical protein
MTTEAEELQRIISAAGRDMLDAYRIQEEASHWTHPRHRSYATEGADGRQKRENAFESARRFVQFSNDQCCAHSFRRFQTYSSRKPIIIMPSTYDASGPAGNSTTRNQILGFPFLGSR